MEGLAVYLINLPRSTDRRPRTRAMLAGPGLPCALVPGVSGREEWARCPHLNFGHDAPLPFPSRFGTLRPVIPA